MSTQPVYDAIADQVLSEDADIIAVNPPADMVFALATRLSETVSPPTLRILGPDDVLRSIRRVFPVAARLAELEAAGTVTIRNAAVESGTTLFCTEEVVYALAIAGESTDLLSLEDGDFVSTAYVYYDERVTEATPFSLRTPPLADVEETLADEFDDTVAEDFIGLTELLFPVTRYPDIDPETIGVIVAAKHGLQLYRISKWGEDVGVASRATFSREKAELEEAGLIKTEKVPMDVGRPRLKLHLAEDELIDRSGDELLSELKDRL